MFEVKEMELERMDLVAETGMPRLDLDDLSIMIDTSRHTPHSMYILPNSRPN